MTEVKLRSYFVRITCPHRRAFLFRSEIHDEKWLREILKCTACLWPLRCVFSGHVFNVGSGEYECPIRAFGPGGHCRGYNTDNQPLIPLTAIHLNHSETRYPETRPQDWCSLWSHIGQLASPLNNGKYRIVIAQTISLSSWARELPSMISTPFCKYFSVMWKSQL